MISISISDKKSTLVKVNFNDLFKIFKAFFVDPFTLNIAIASCHSRNCLSSFCWKLFSFFSLFIIS